jgi:exodeoxyribonuclease V alpha subunit
METLEVLDEHPDRLLEIPGLGERKAKSIAAAWTERRALKDLMVFLQSQGLPIVLAVRILKKYGGAAEAIIRQQPYRMAAEVYGVSFETADAMASRLGVPHDAQQRITAGVTHTLRRASESGHVYLPQETLEQQASRLLGVNIDKVRAALPAMREGGHIEMESLGGKGPTPGVQAVYLPEMHSAEEAVCEALKGLLVGGRDRLAAFRNADWETAWRYVSSRETVHLTEKQREAVQAALTRRVAVITGGPGTGKTTTLRGIVRLVHAKNGKVALAAPTGRAAKRLSEATGAQASTIHRLLELRPGGQYEARAPLDADLVIIDEASMMDLPLCEALLKAVPAGAHVLFVGDADQLPPVGPGSVFRDVIASGLVPIVTLDTIFRQPEGSAIVSNAHLINAGVAPVTGKHITDFFFFNQPDAAQCADLVVDLATKRVPDKFGLDPMDEIQVIVPMYKGVCGIESLNARLQAVLNPPHPTKDERRYGDRIYRVGDKVMQVVNDYEKQVANGDMGRIARIDLDEKLVEVSFEGEWLASYSFQELDELSHGFAISVHKAQGSEYPAVIMPVLAQHHRLLQRNLLYTAVSRARQLVVLAGSRDALARGVENTTLARRNTGLVERLRKA